jgi:FlaA1/EpsC-like NDP-sugar epimerase
MGLEDVDIVFHAAALKHVVSCELNPFEAVKTNVAGTQNVIECALANDIEKVVSVSTDKAADPTSVMGCTKLLAERLVLSTYFYQGKKRTKFCSVRFGNVIGSRGSVVPLFVRQIKKGGPVTVTDPSMTRFFMSISQAVELMFKASDLMRGHEIFILKMPVAKIGDLAESVIELTREKFGIKNEIKIDIVGKRVAERQHEKLLFSEEAEQAIERDEMFIIRPNVDYYLFHSFAKENYPGTQSTELSDYSSQDAKPMTKRQIREMLLSNWDPEA